LTGVTPAKMKSSSIPTVRRPSGASIDGPSQIRALRKKRKLSLEELASRIGFKGTNARITVWRWETGKRKPSEQTIMLMRQLTRRGDA
jgi:DNA-binding transcriptional regulator YiaG